VLRTFVGDLHARQVVVASGAYPKPHRPRSAAQIPPSIPVIPTRRATRSQKHSRPVRCSLSVVDRQVANSRKSCANPGGVYTLRAGARPGCHGGSMAVTLWPGRSRRPSLKPAWGTLRARACAWAPTLRSVGQRRP
jgi:hypothetical protein